MLLSQSEVILHVCLLLFVVSEPSKIKNVNVSCWESVMYWLFTQKPYQHLMLLLCLLT